jgi:hypothetical protein
LASHFRIRFAPRLFTGRRSGLDAGFFDQRLQRQAGAISGPKPRKISLFLVNGVKDFLFDQKAKMLRHKRGGRIRFESFEGLFEISDLCTSAAEGLTTYPEEAVFDLNWAATIAAQALRRLREECESRGHRSTCECLRDYLTADRSETSYRHLSTELGVSEASVKRLVRQFRTRYRAVLREEVAKTVESSSEVDAEVRYLCTVLASRPCLTG